MVGVGGAAVLCAVMTYPQAWAVAAAVGALLVVGLLFPPLAVNGVGVGVGFSQRRCRQGETVGVRLEVVNRRWFPMSGIEIHGVPGLGAPGDSGVPGRKPGGVMVSLPGRGRREMEFEFTPVQRGEYPRAGMKVSSGFPLGIRVVEREIVVGAAADARKPAAGGASRDVGQDAGARRGGQGDGRGDAGRKGGANAGGGRLLVWPSEVAVDMPEIDASARPGDALLAGRRPGTTGDLTGLRPYRRGDAVREIHWRQTARHGRLIVRERQSPASPRMLLVLDTGTGSYESASHREHAISTAAALLRKLIESQLTVDVLVGLTLISGDMQQGSGGGGSPVPGWTPQGVAVMDHLARLGDDGPVLGETLLRVPGMASNVLVITSTRSAAALRSAARQGTQWIEVQPPAVEVSVRTPEVVEAA